MGWLVLFAKMAVIRALTPGCCIFVRLVRPEPTPYQRPESSIEVPTGRANIFSSKKGSKSAWGRAAVVSVPPKFGPLFVVGRSINHRGLVDGLSVHRRLFRRV